MPIDSEEEPELLENAADVIDGIKKEVKELYVFRDLFFENHPLEMASQKNKMIEEKKEALVEKLESIDVDTQIPFQLRAQLLYLKGRCYNVGVTYDARATQCLSKAVKLNPHLVDAWNELGGCYWKNMNVKEAKASFEGALKHERNRLALRCLSIILRQELSGKKPPESTQVILKSVELAKQAVAQDIKDGLSWTVLGNAYLCQFFAVAQDPATLKLCMSAYKQAWLDPVAKGQPDLYYNWGMALKYEELFKDAVENFEYSCKLDPTWEPPKLELKKVVQYLAATNDLVRTKGKVKTKKLTQMTQNTEKKMLGIYTDRSVHKINNRDVSIEHITLRQLQEGNNDGKVILGRVVGSIHSENAVPFTFALVDESMHCICVTVYNWADGKGVIIGDCVTIPNPVLAVHKYDGDSVKYDFSSIRINSPTLLLVNGKRVSRNQFASTRVSSTYDIY